MSFTNSMFNFPAMDPFVMPPDAFNGLIAAYGVDLLWLKSHQCPCTYSSGYPGSGAPNCLTCSGRGVYWDPPSASFRGFITFMHFAPSPDEPGMTLDKKFGQAQHGEPVLTIPSTADPAETIYNEASIYDAFVQTDNITRYTTELKVGGTMAVPYQQSLSIAKTGAVRIWDADTAQVVLPSYTVSGAVVTLPDTYPAGTPYMVEFQAATVFIAFRPAGGLPHNRPEGGGLKLPKRYRLQPLDIWTRERSTMGTGPQGI